MCPKAGTLTLREGIESVEIDGTTQLAGVIGDPLTHTLSPAMHNAAYAALDLDWAYLPFRITDEVGLHRFLAALPSMSVVGLNVTMPYKQTVVELCDDVAAAARMAGAVNTIHVTDGRLLGYNTDGRGLIESLRDEASLCVEGKDVVLLGTGGAAAAAFVAFVLERARSVTVVGRNLVNAGELVARLSPHLGAVDARAMTFDEAGTAVRDAHLVVNATPLGMRPGDASPIEPGSVGQGQVVFDMVYGTAQETRLIAESRAAGAVALDGLGMLVSQGAIAIDIWNTSIQSRAPRDVMRAAAQAKLDERRARG